MLLQIGTATVGLGLIIALVVIVIGLGNQMVNGAGGGSVSAGDRRGFLKGIVALFVVALLGGSVGEVALSELFESDSGNCLLFIDSAETERIGSDETLSACGINWSDSGTMTVENDGTLVLTEQ